MTEDKNAPQFRRDLMSQRSPCSGKGLTLSDYLAAHARSTPQKEAVIDSKARVSYEQLHRVSDRIACAFLQLGIKQGDVVSVQLPNWVEFFFIYCALSKIGAVINPLVPVYRSTELQHILGLAQSVALIIPSQYRKFDYVSMARELLPALPCLRHVIVTGENAPSGMKSFSELTDVAWEKKYEEDYLRQLRDQQDAGDLTLLLFTSGTEAAAKGVMHTHKSINFAMKTRAKVVRFGSDDNILVMSPITAGMGFFSGLYMSIMYGAKSVLVEKWDPPEALKLIQQERCTFTHTAPTFLYDLLNSPELPKYDLSSLKFISCGGAAITRDLVEKIQKNIGCKVGRVYGSSETIICSMTDPDEQIDKILETNGRAPEGVKLRVVDESNNELPPGQTGEAVVRSPALFKGYYKRPDLDAASFDKEGWFHTGDLCSIDKEGYVRVAGRKKDMIKRGGFNISASEIEGILCSHPKIREISVIGVPDERLGEKVCVCVIPKPGETIALDDIIAFMKAQKIAVWKLPEKLETFSEFPLTSTGKVRKEALKKRILSES